ncbi:hypothetical protein ACQ4M3_06640 [Leptolyngbya sp. AN03gr2]|uniref:hypothetical protein n=1 Tax=unclassified Leptolyngbya TaxID=2650499 RepID=UPI003D311BBB
MKRSILLGFVAPVLFASVAEAREPGHACFVRINGKTTDLSTSVCQNAPMPEAEIAKNFLAELRWKSAYSPRGEALSEAVEKNSQKLVESAKAYCEARKSGASDAQIVQVQRQAVPQMARLNRSGQNFVMSFVRLNNQLAVKHFCPELL